MDEIGKEFIVALLAFVSAAVMFFMGKSSEKKSVNVAILAEIQRLQSVLERHQAWWEKCMTSGKEVPLIPFSMDVYQSQIAHVGIIEQAIVADVVRFYGYIDFLNTLQNKRDEYEKRGDDEGFKLTYGRTLATVVEDFGEKFIDAFTAHEIN